MMVTASLKIEALIKYLRHYLFSFSAYFLFLLPTSFYPFSSCTIHTLKLIEIFNGLLNAAKQ